MVKHPISGFYELFVTLCDPEDPKIRLLTTCRRDPLMAPVPTTAAMTDRNVSREYFQTRLRGMVWDDDGVPHRTAQLGGSEDQELFWVDVHRKAYDRCDIILRHAFSDSVM